MYTVRIFDTEDGHTDTEYATEELAFGAVYVDELPLPLETEPTFKDIMPSGFAIYKEGVCFHVIGHRADIGDPL